MTNTREGLLLDPDGIPILTDLVHDDVTPNTAGETRKSGNDEVSVDELASLLLNSDTFKEQLDKIAAELTRSVRQQLELALRPTLEEAILLAFDDEQYNLLRSRSQTARGSSARDCLPVHCRTSKLLKDLHVARYAVKIRFKVLM